GSLRGLGAREAVGLATLGLAHIARKDGDDARLYSLVAESGALLRETSSPGLVDWLSFVGQVRIERGKFAQGLRLLASGDADGPRFGSQRALAYLMPREDFETSVRVARAGLDERAF